MPSKIELWTCHYCGAQYDVQGHAKLCEEAHLHAKDLHIRALTKIGGLADYYYPHNKFPAAITVGDGQGNSETYVLQRVSARSTGGALRRRGITLHKE